MRIMAYQFAVSSKIENNYDKIKTVIYNAKNNNVDIVVFPECSLTGYPPIDIESSKNVNFNLVNEYLQKLQNLCNKTNVAFIVGLVAKDRKNIFNRACFFIPNKVCAKYDKRALWGYDIDNFNVGKKKGIIDYNGYRIGIRICYEVRFPEYFRELFKKKTDLDIVMFYDVSNIDDIERYNLIKAHLQTRAVENVSFVISSNSISPYQTAPTAIFNRSGQIIFECKRNEEDYILFDLEKVPNDFGEVGRKKISNLLVK